MTAPHTARNVSRGIPSQSAHSRPGPRLVDDRLANVEDDRPRSRRQVGGHADSERSCQVMPPSGAPGMLLVLQAGSLVDLLDAAQVEAVDEDRVDIGIADRAGRPASRPRPRPGRTSRVARSSSRSGSDPGWRNTVPMTRNGGASRATSYDTLWTLWAAFSDSVSSGIDPSPASTRIRSYGSMLSQAGRLDHRPGAVDRAPSGRRGS